MVKSSRRRGPAVAKRQLRLALRRARYAAALTQNEVADALDWHTSKILRIENGQVSVATSDLMALIALYPGLGPERLPELVELAREGRRPSFAGRYRDVLTPQFAEWLEYEAYAVSIRQFESQFVPGVLQTDEYAAATVRGLLGNDADDERVEQIVAARIERAEPLTGPDGPRMEFIVDEAVLWRGVGNEPGNGGRAIMPEQLRHLRRMNTVGRAITGDPVEPGLNPGMSVQVVPFGRGAYAAMRRPFELVNFEDPDDVAMLYFESPAGDEVIRDGSDETARHQDLFDELTDVLPGPERTGAVIDRVLAAMADGGCPTCRFGP
jgi:transcriptional regulator with XRE-family HTH domain